MCGLTGGWFLRGFKELYAALPSMTDAIAHRGPDDQGHWFDQEAGVALGHRRLSIVDLSRHGHQPMISASGRYVLIYNGEIYNHAVLRRELEKAPYSPAWIGHSDTETLLAGIEIWGLVPTLKRSIGMFALVLWDRQSHELWLARDRLGEKPLYYGLQQGNLSFGSELKSIRLAPGFSGEIDRNSLALLLRYGVVPAPYSIYRDIAKLMPGSVLRIAENDLRTGILPLADVYWSVAETALYGKSHPFCGSDNEAVGELEVLLKDAVGQQMVADVPLGAFLSGGVDSSTVVALMQALSSRPVKTFTIGFNEQGYNEALDAESVATYLGTDHTELYVSPQQVMDVIPRLPCLYCEPFSDSSQIPTFLVSQLARQHVKVSLSGDAGDEVFCGYNRYTMTSQNWQKLLKLPLGLRRLIAAGLTRLSPHIWDKILAPAKSILPRSFRMVEMGYKLHKAAGALVSCSVNDLYLELVSYWTDPTLLVNNVEPATLLADNTLPLDGLDAVQRMMALDMMTYLPDDILVKLDRAAMSVSLESRVPFLDHRVVEFAWCLPQSMKLRDGQGKWVLRQVLYHHVPKELIERPKMGFGVPIDTWLRGPLRDWAEALLDESRLRQEGFFNPVPIRQKWEQHLSGARNWKRNLWSVLMFQAWLEKAHG